MGNETVSVAWSTRLSSTGTSERLSLAHRVPSADASFTLCGRPVPVAVRNHLRGLQPFSMARLVSWEDPVLARACTSCETACR